MKFQDFRGSERHGGVSGWDQDTDGVRDPPGARRRSETVEPPAKPPEPGKTIPRSRKIEEDVARVEIEVGSAEDAHVLEDRFDRLPKRSELEEQDLHGVHAGVVGLEKQASGVRGQLGLPRVPKPCRLGKSGRRRHLLG
jgi:hypothetical protein